MVMKIVLSNQVNLMLPLKTSFELELKLQFCLDLDAGLYQWVTRVTPI